MLQPNAQAGQSWLVIFLVALLGFGSGSGALQAEDRIFHDRFEGPPNEPPVIELIPDQTIAALSTFSYQVSATDPWPPWDVLRYALNEAPSGMVINEAGGLISWTPTETQIGAHLVSVRVNDAYGGVASTGFQINVTGADNEAPTLQPIADRSIRIGQVLSIEPVASDPDLPNDVLSFSLDGAPAGLSLARASGSITWAPTENQIGVWPVTLTVTDQGGLSDSTSFSMTVIGLGSPPSIEAIADQSLLIGELLDVNAQASDPDLPDDELSFSLLRAPQGMGINPNTGRITWTPGPDRVGAHDVSVQVADRIGLIDFTDFVVRVNPPNQAPVALNDEYRVRRGDTLSVLAPGVMDNDFDPDGDPISAELLSGPQRGALDFRADGGFDYTPGNAVPSFEAELVASFRQMTINGVTRPWYVHMGSVVAGDLTGNGRSELLSIGVRGSTIANTQHLTVLSFSEDDELEVLWTWNGWLGANPVLDPNRDFAMRGARDVVIGDLYGDGVPEVVVTGYCRGDILIFSNTGERLVSTQAGRVPLTGETSPECPAFYGSGSVADAGRLSLVDLSGNGLPEILLAFRGELRAFEGTGTLLWEAQAPGYVPGDAEFDLAVADVNLDGRPNIWFGGSLFDADGTVMWSKANTVNSQFRGTYAVANLNEDPFAELIFWGVGPELIVLDHQGQCLWQARQGSNPSPTPGLGCPTVTPIPELSTTMRRGLMVGDIAGDGISRIVVGSSGGNSNGDLFNRVMAFNPDGTLFWSVPARLPAGPSVRVNQINGFDFNGNGLMELVVTGANGSVVLDGRDGSTLFGIPADADNPGTPTSIGPDMLYSIIVDLDGDAAAELVLASRAYSGLNDEIATGLFVYRDPHKRWMPTRPVWNEWGYSVTNVNPDLSIPSPAKPNWQEPGLNNYRVNALPVAERVGAVRVDSFREMVIDGISRFWRVNSGTVVAGDLTGNGRSELLAIGQRGSGIANTQYLTAVSFNENHELDLLWYWNGWYTATPNRDFAMRAARDPVIGDLTGDGVPEVVVTGYCAGEILIFSNLGQPLISTQAGRVPVGSETSPECPQHYGSLGDSGQGRLSLVDLSGDGLPNILLSFDRRLRAFDGAGALLWEVQAPNFGPGNREFDYAIADVNLDGRPNIWFGGTLFNADGNVLWGKATNPLSNDWSGWYAVANLNDDPFGELIYWGLGPDLIVFDHQGNCLWQARKSSSVNPPPTLGCPSAIQIPDLPTSSPGFRAGLIVADITGDGKPRIVIGNRTNSDGLARNRVIAFNPDGTPLWSVPALLSSGASVRVNQINAFDLTGNGVMEVVVTGVNGTVVLNGRNGQTLFEIPADDDNPGLGTSTGQDMLYSIVVDLDGDGAAELVVSSQGSSGFSGETATGLFVYRHPQNRWMPARQVWNQWVYSVTNINPDLSVPSVPERNWLTPGLNNHRVNAFMPGEGGAVDAFTYRVSDGELASNEATVYLDIRRPNRPPAFISTPITLAAVGLDYRYRVQAVDPDPGDEVTLRFNQGPAGMSFGADQVLRWQPGAADLGAHPIVLSGIDLEGEISIQEFVLEVVEPVAVPDVLGLARSDAVAAVAAAGFVSGRISERFDEDFAAGLVAGQQPGAGSLQVPGTGIDLDVSKGPAPIDDSTPPEFPVEAILIDPDAFKLLSGETVRLKAFAVFADGSTQLITRAVNWSSDSAAVSVNANGRISALAAGSATISAEIDGMVGQASAEVSARDPGDDEGPVALISAPNSGQVVFEPVEIIGTVFDEQLVRYELAMSPAGQGTWVLLNQSTSNVDDAVLGTFDPTVLLNGFYDIRLRVLDAGGNESIDEITVQADGEQKAGLFTLAFTDLSLPLGGLPITIERVYDSRDRSMGDFGMGWRLGLRSIELKCASRLGEDWFVARSGLSFSLLPMREKACAISLPGGRMEVFDFVVTPSSSPFVPFVTVRGQLKPRPGTLGQIEILDNTNFLILDQQPGEVWLYDDATFNPFNPVRLRYTVPDGTAFEFTDGQVSRVIDLNGNSLSFSLDGIEHSSGIGVDFERDALGRITAITDPSGHTQTYAYSANGDLASHTDVLGNTTRFFYNSRHGLVRIEDPQGFSAIRSEYDARGRLIALIDAAGDRTEHEYDDAARLKTTTFPDGSVRTVAYDERGNIEVQGQLVTIDGVPVFSEQTWEYDEFGNPTRTVDPDGVVEEVDWSGEREWTRRVIDPGGLNLIEEQDFDDRGRVTRFTDALGRHRDYQYDSRGNVVLSPGPGGVDIGMAYESGGRLAAIANPRGERTRLSYNAAGQVIARVMVDPQGLVLSRTEFVRDANGRVITQTEVPLAGEGAPRVTTFSYDALGRIIRVSNPLGEITSFEYDANGQNTAMVDPLGRRTEMDYDARGLMIERRLPDGGIEQLDYDHAGRMTRHIDPDGVIRDTEYDELGRAVVERVDGQLIMRRILSPGGRLVAEIDALGQRTDHDYDSAGRHIRTRLPEVFDAVSASLQRPEILMEYNALGQRTAMVDPLGRRTEYVYDAAGHLSQVIHPDGSARLHQFDAAGRHLSVSDEEGHSSLFEYDAAGRLIRVLQPAPGPGQPRPETRFVYDSFGQLRTRIDALGRVTAFEYDGAGRPIRTILPDGSSRATEYDAAGRAIRVIDFDATVLEFEHDAMGRMLSRSTSGLVEAISYTAAGRRAQISDSRGLTSFSYDGQGRMTGFVEGDGLGIDYQFDANGRIVSLTVDGQTTSYGWDALGRLESVTTAAGTTSYAYDLAGQLREKTLPNGVVRAAEYDDRGRPLTVALRGPDDSLIESFISTYSPRGKRLSVTTSDGAVESYDYDSIGRLVEAGRTGADAFDLSFEYDPVGNRLRQVFDGIETVYGYGLNHELLSAGGDSFSYDARGNRTSAVVQGEMVSYQWDAFGRLVGTISPDGSAQFDYDIDNRRVARTVNGQRTAQLIDPQSVSGFSQVVAEFDTNAQLLARWDYGRQVLSQHRAGQVHHYSRDHRGSVHLLSDAAGQVSDRYAYLPFGDLLSSSGSTPNPYRFNAERWESTARSYDLRARSYDSCSGTFLSRDPFPGFQNRPFSLHPYQFGDADPVNHIDPLGLFTLIELNLTQSIMGGVRLSDAGARVAAFCSAVAKVETVSTVAAMVELAVFMINAGMQGELGLSGSTEIRLPKQHKLGIKITPKIKPGSGTLFAGYEAEFTVSRASGTDLASFKIEKEGGEYKASLGRDFKVTMLRLEFCGAIPLAQLSVIWSPSISATAGDGVSFSGSAADLKWNLSFGDDGSFGGGKSFDSGGFSGPIPLP